jgi:hypothetical protein
MMKAAAPCIDPPSCVIVGVTVETVDTMSSVWTGARIEGVGRLFDVLAGTTRVEVGEGGIDPIVAESVEDVGRVDVAVVGVMTVWE